MAKTLYEHISQLKISEVISNYISLSKKGRNYIALCPFHQDKNPSLIVSDEKGIFKCFSCGHSGNAINFVSDYKSIPYFSAAIEIAKTMGIDQNVIHDYENKSADKQANYLIYKLNKSYSELTQNYLKSQKYKGQYEYLINRGIHQQSIQYFQIGYNPPYQESQIYSILTGDRSHVVNVYGDNIFQRQDLIDAGLISISKSGQEIDFFSDRIIFPIHDHDGEIVGFSGRLVNRDDGPKYLNTQQTKLFNKNEILYNFYHVKHLSKIDHLYLVEGFMDVISLHEAGIENVVATMGVAFSQQHLKAIKSFNHLKSVVLCFDNDEAGKTAKLESAKLLKNYFDVFVVNQFETKDVDEYKHKFGIEKLKEAMNNMSHISLYAINDLSSQIKNWNELTTLQFYNQALEAINTYGKEIYLNKYLELLQKTTNYGLEKIKSDLEAISFQKRSNQAKPSITHQYSNIDKSYKAIKYMEYRLLMAALSDCRNAQTIRDSIHNNWTNELENIINFLCHFYQVKPEIKAINHHSYPELVKFHTKYETIYHQLVLEEIKTCLDLPDSEKYHYDERMFMIQISSARIAWYDYHIELLKQNLDYDQMDKLTHLVKQRQLIAKELNKYNKKQRNF